MPNDSSSSESIPSSAVSTSRIDMEMDRIRNFMHRRQYQPHRKSNRKEESLMDLSNIEKVSTFIDRTHIGLKPTFADITAATTHPDTSLSRE
jgi:hypothetical protein